MLGSQACARFDASNAVFVDRVGADHALRCCRHTPLSVRCTEGRADDYGDKEHKPMKATPLYSDTTYAKCCKRRALHHHVIHHHACVFVFEHVTVEQVRCSSPNVCTKCAAIRTVSPGHTNPVSFQPRSITTRPLVSLPRCAPGPGYHGGRLPENGSRAGARYVLLLDHRYARAGCTGIAGAPVLGSCRSRSTRRSSTALTATMIDDTDINSADHSGRNMMLNDG
jgi:hypothetical protein